MEQQRAPGVFGIALKYGLIQGVLSFLLFLAGALTGIKQNWVSSVINAALFIILMVLAHREFKRTHEGRMTYPQGLGSGTLLAVAATVISCVLTYVYLKYINAGFLAALLQAQRAALEQRGISGAQEEQAMAFTAAIMTPGGFVVISLITGVILGFIVALIVSIFTHVDDPKAVI
jgi:uncharacterized membrane protein (DUF485 family)